MNNVVIPQKKAIVNNQFDLWMNFIKSKGMIKAMYAPRLFAKMNVPIGLKV